MKLRSFLSLSTLTILCSVLTANAAISAEFETVESLRAAVKTYTDNTYKQQFGEKKFSRDIRTKVSNLDPRLKLSKCESPLVFGMVKSAHQSRNITVKTSCENPRPWTIYVPVSLEIYADVVVATRSLARGTILETADLQYKRMNTSKLSHGHIKDISRIVGMELRRPAGPGEHLLLSSMREAKVIAKGDSVVLEARNSTISVATRGTALAAGEKGQQIKVRNNQSERVVDATVLGPGRVAVLFK